MGFADRLLTVASGMTWRAPGFRGSGRLYRHLNRAALKMGAQPIVTARMRDGTRMRVDLRADTEALAYYQGQYEPDLIESVRALLDPASIFLDIGANIGFYTVAIGAWMASHGGTGRVFAFEPFDGNYRRLIQNIEANGLGEYCRAHNIGLSDASTGAVVTLREDFRLGSNTGNASIPVDDEFDKGFERRAIRLEPLDGIWPSLHGGRGRIDLIKLDIEGHEDFCLLGAQQTIAEDRPTILMELNKPYYEARRVSIDERFLPLIPERYRMYRQTGLGWQRFESFGECLSLDNAFLVPVEKLNLPQYGIFATTA